ncbi:carboxymuconolactone decarboxylase family protein [Enhygromyxa salina]|uniref:Carboxymuconolactone decarboxylase family protein n=1 Tax=Enhygromyxa salina TaxID=215803 RepID=A0A2S9YSM1_9BACT|nr:hypothetical protein [Enhygromyxa salina]PRQ08086.1 hypothetical protein ENSA7_22400 [Enhygromyxa salina]
MDDDATTPDHAPGKPTLEYALRPFAVSREEIVKRYRAVALMVRQILGVVPHAMGYFEIWPPAFTTYSVLVPSLLDIPRCDLGRGISPDLRSLVVYVASRSYDCAYCSAHAAGMGTIFKGPGGSLLRNAEAMAPLDSSKFEPSDLAAIDYATAVAQMPTEVTLDHRLALARHFSERDEESVVLAATLMGFLNCAVDTLGVVLEQRLLTQSQAHLAASAWTPSKNYDERYDREVVEADAETDDGETLNPLELAQTIAGVIGYSRASLSTIEKRPDKIYAQVEAALGFVPSYLLRISRTPAKRVLAHLLIERLHTMQGPTGMWLKYAMGFVAAKASHNELLAAHYAYGAMRSGANVGMLRDALEPSQAETREAAAFALARAISSPPVELRNDQILSLMRGHSPVGIIELIVTLATYTLLHRYTSTYPAVSYEPPIAAFVEAHGEALGLAAQPNSHAASWDQQVASVQRSA